MSCTFSSVRGEFTPIMCIWCSITIIFFFPSPLLTNKKKKIKKRPSHTAPLCCQCGSNSSLVINTYICIEVLRTSIQNIITPQLVFLVSDAACMHGTRRLSKHMLYWYIYKCNQSLSSSCVDKRGPAGLVLAWSKALPFTWEKAYHYWPPVENPVLEKGGV